MSPVHNTPGLDRVRGASQHRKRRHSRHRIIDDLVKGDPMEGAMCNMDSPEMVRVYVVAGVCPICGRGPWQNLASHTVRSHGIDGNTIRECARMLRSEALCSEEFAENLRAHFDGVAMNARQTAEARRGRFSRDCYSTVGLERMREAHRAGGDMGPIRLHGQFVSMRRCTVCGELFWPKPNMRKRKTCGDSCLRAANSAAAKRVAAKRARARSGVFLAVETVRRERLA